MGFYPSLSRQGTGVFLVLSQFYSGPAPTPLGLGPELNSSTIIGERHSSPVSIFTEPFRFGIQTYDNALGSVGSWFNFYRTIEVVTQNYIHVIMALGQNNIQWTTSVRKADL